MVGQVIAMDPIKAGEFGFPKRADFSPAQPAFQGFNLAEAIGYATKNPDQPIAVEDQGLLIPVFAGMAPKSYFPIRAAIGEAAKWFALSTSVTARRDVALATKKALGYLTAAHTLCQTVAGEALLPGVGWQGPKSKPADDLK